MVSGLYQLAPDGSNSNAMHCTSTTSSSTTRHPSKYPPGMTSTSVFPCIFTRTTQRQDCHSMRWYNRGNAVQYCQTSKTSAGTCCWNH